MERNPALKIDKTVTDLSIDKQVIKSFNDKIERVESKIRDDIFRFRTCCVDPRASK